MAKQKDPNEKINIFTLLKDLVGKDLTRVSMPVYLNEPISMLQRTSEIFEHTNALDAASEEKNQYKRLAYFMGFIIMNLAQAVGRNKKPFNPLLGETFELNVGGMRGICEQVSHHPPISALHCENENFKVWGYFEPKSKFTFTKMLVTPKTQLYCYLKKSKEKFYLPKLPNSSVHNLLRGDLYVWHFGAFEVRNLTTGDKCQVEFKSHPMFGSLDFTFKGNVCDAEGNILTTGNEKLSLLGSWDKNLFCEDPSLDKQLLIQKKEKLPNSEFMFGFPKWSIEMSNLTKEQLLYICPSDSRLRPDQRAYENGDVDLAAAEKHRLEESQRRRRRIRKENDEQFTPRWFRKVEDVDTGEETYEYIGGYWETRETGDWDKWEIGKVIDLFND